MEFCEDFEIVKFKEIQGNVCCLCYRKIDYVIVFSTTKTIEITGFLVKIFSKYIIFHLLGVPFYF